MRLRAFILLAALVLAACGGGGSTGTSLAPVSVPTAASTGRAQLRIVIPATTATTAAPHRAYIGSDAAGLTVAVGPHGGTPSTTAFSLSGSACTTTGGERSCSIFVTAPFGNDDFAVAIYDAAPVNGAIPTTAHLLGTASETNVAVTAGVTPPSIALVVAAQVGNLGVSSSLITLPANGTAQLAAIVLTPSDFNNQPIGGTSTAYANPITVALAETGGSGHTVLTVNGSPVGTSTTLTQSSQSLGIAYDGGGSPGYAVTITLSATGASNASVAIVPMFVSTTSPYFTSGALGFTGTSQSASFNVSEALASLSYTASTGSCSGTTSANGSGASGVVTITSVSAAASPCALQITDLLGATYSIPYTTTTTGGGPTIGGVTEYAMPLGSSARPEPIVAGPDGNLWVGDEAAGAIDKVTTSGAITVYPVPSGHGAPFAIAAANDGDLWYVDGSNELYQVTTGGQITPHAGLGAGPFEGITVGSDGNLWVTDQNDAAVLQVSLQAQLLKSYTADLNVTAIASGSDGNLYALSPASTGTFYQIAPGSTPASFTIFGSCASPTSIAPNPVDGNVYIGCASSIDQISPLGSQLVFGIGQMDGVRGLVAGPDGSVWFTAPATNSIGRYYPTSGAFTHYAVPTSGAYPLGIALGPDGRIWFTEFSAGKIGVITP